jgi:hypothetical protein
VTIMRIEEVLPGQNFRCVENPSVLFKKIESVTDRYDNIFIAVAPDGLLADTDTIPPGSLVELSSDLF